MMFLIVGILLLLLGFICLYKSNLKKKFYEQIKNGNINDYNKTIGIVICDAYHISEAAEIIKAVTPIVEYEVDGKKYEAQNSVLETGAELPVGTKMYVWYKKDNPKIAILATELDSYSFKRIIGIMLIVFGIMFTFIGM